MQPVDALPADPVLQRMFSLAHYLHPERLVALCVTLDACDWIPQVRRAMSRRSTTEHSHKQKLPESTIPRFAVYAASQSWEIDQESSDPQKNAKYQPNQEDQLIRYIKFLIWTTMERPCCYAAVAIGHFLYSYHLKDIANLAPDYFNEDNIRRINGYLSGWIQRRFGDSGIFSTYGNYLERRPPSEHELVLIKRSLEVLAPRYALASQHIPAGNNVLDTYFNSGSPHSELERVRSIIDPGFIGFERMVNEYNRSLSGSSKVKLAPTDKMCRIPKFDDKILVFPTSDSGSRRGSELSRTEITLIKRGAGWKN